jgi:hypothetical protein
MHVMFDRRCEREGRHLLPEGTTTEHRRGLLLRLLRPEAETASSCVIDKKLDTAVL